MSASYDEEPPEWVTENNPDEMEIGGGEDISRTKVAEANPDAIPAADGVRLTIKKIQVDLRTPKNKEIWRTAEMNVWLQITDGITYKKGEQPKYKGMMFFHRFGFAVNRDAEAAGIYDFSVNAKGAASDYYNPAGTGDFNFFGQYNEFLKAIKHAGPTPKVSKAWRESKEGLTIIADVARIKATTWDREKSKEVNIPGDKPGTWEMTNELRKLRPDTSAKAGKAATAKAPAATPAPDWVEETEEATEE